MKNPSDYQAGFTTPVYVPGKDRPLTGGAARNYRLGQSGGVSGAQDRARVETLVAYNAMIAPVFNAQNKKIDDLTDMVRILIQRQGRDDDAVSYA